TQETYPLFLARKNNKEPQCTLPLTYEQLCNDDSDCCSGLKCCSNGCGNECMTPVIGKI
uniref:WAP domain-containing protein n=1 Tax=Poecilia mexicana TaxID=48701 RepID=A0A3B3Y939_9TELE